MKHDKTRDSGRRNTILRTKVNEQPTLSLKNYFLQEVVCLKLIILSGGKRRRREKAGEIDKVEKYAQGELKAPWEGI